MTTEPVGPYRDLSDDPLLPMIKHSLRFSGAPRVLLGLLVLGPGEHRLQPGTGEDGEVWVFVSGEGPTRRAAASILAEPGSDGPAALPPVWSHLLLEGLVLREGKALTESPPEVLDHAFDLADLASASDLASDLCESLGLPYDPALAGVPLPPPSETLPLLAT